MAELCRSKRLDFATADGWALLRLTAGLYYGRRLGFVAADGWALL